MTKNPITSPSLAGSKNNKYQEQLIIEHDFRRSTPRTQPTYLSGKA